MWEHSAPRATTSSISLAAVALSLAAVLLLAAAATAAATAAVADAVATAFCAQPRAPLLGTACNTAADAVCNTAYGPHSANNVL